MPEFDLGKAINILTPVVLTIAANLAFYLFIKGRVDKKIEEHKVSYSGLFKEKIDTYRSILLYIHECRSLQKDIFEEGNIENIDELQKKAKSFLSLLSSSKAFFPSHVLAVIEKLEDLWKIADDRTTRVVQLSNQIKSLNDPNVTEFQYEEFFNGYGQLLSILLSDELDKLKDLVFVEMRKDLRTD